MNNAFSIENITAMHILYIVTMAFIHYDYRDSPIPTISIFNPILLILFLGEFDIDLINIQTVAFNPVTIYDQSIGVDVLEFLCRHSPVEDFTQLIGPVGTVVVNGW
jgi:hypothetical protein